MGNYLGQATTKMRRLEDVCEDAPDVDPCPFIGVNAQGAKPKIERANIVETENMVGVAMRDQDGVKTLQSISQGLLAKVGRSVNQNRLAGMFDENGDS